MIIIICKIIIIKLKQILMILVKIEQGAGVDTAFQRG